MTAGSPNRAARRSLARRGGALGAGGVLVAGSAAALLTALAGSAGAAASITVDSNADGAADATHCTDSVFYNCTLRDAATLAADGDTITFYPSVTNITLTNGFVGLRAVNVAGPGSASLAITTTADAGSYNIFTFTGTGDATISGLTLTKNRIEARNDGNFTVDGVTVSGSEGAQALYSAYGGALYAANSGNLVISGSHFEENYAGLQCFGGAVFSNNPGLVAINDSEFINNAALGYGGGIFVSRNAASFSLTNSVVTGNSANGGGGLEVRTYGTVTIADSDISSNTATNSGSGGAYFKGGSLAADVLISGSTFDGNIALTRRAGGGLAVQNRSLVVNDSTISNNASGAYGGGIAVSGHGERVVIINNSTIAGNQGVVGGLYASRADVVINQSTISSNVGTQNSGGVLHSGGVLLYGGSLQVSGTIISGNSSATAGIEDVKSLYNASISSDHSILGTVYGYGTTVTDLGGTINSTTPGLLALADNGGPTLTMALDPTSIAIDAGPDPVATFTGNGFDQRGTPYVRVSGSAVDIGAFELQADPPPTSSTTSTSTTSTTSTTTVPTSSTSTTTVPTSSTSTSTTTVATSSTSTTAPPASTTTLAIDPNDTVGDDPMAPAFTG